MQIGGLSLSSNNTFNYENKGANQIDRGSWYVINYYIIYIYG